MSHNTDNYDALNRVNEEMRKDEKEGNKSSKSSKSSKRKKEDSKRKNVMPHSKEAIRRYMLSSKRLPPICEDGEGCRLIYGKYPYRLGQYMNYDCTTFCSCLHPGETRRIMSNRLYLV
jgi:hypothetical protein